MPLTEDGYYSLSVARNLAAGKGMTIDGANLTNGFQPLFTMIEARRVRARRRQRAPGDPARPLLLVAVSSWPEPSPSP